MWWCIVNSRFTTFPQQVIAQDQTLITWKRTVLTFLFRGRALEVNWEMSKNETKIELDCSEVCFHVLSICLHWQPLHLLLHPKCIDWFWCTSPVAIHFSFACWQISTFSNDDPQTQNKTHHEGFPWMLMVTDNIVVIKIRLNKVILGFFLICIAHADPT